MPSELIQRRIDAFIIEADEAFANDNLDLAADRAQRALALDPANEDAQAFLDAVERVRILVTSVMDNS